MSAEDLQIEDLLSPVVSELIGDDEMPAHAIVIVQTITADGPRLRYFLPSGVVPVSGARTTGVGVPVSGAAR